MKKYYDLHVFYTKKESFSVPLAIDTEVELTEVDVIDFAVKKDHIDIEDSERVDYVNEIEEEDYKSMIKI